MTDFGSRLPEIVTPPPGRASRAYAARLRRVESRNVTYVDDGWPVFWERAAGANVQDADGNVYLDLTGAFGVALLGHAPPAVTRAVADQSELLVHGMGDIHPPTAKLELLESLVSFAPWDDAKAILAGSGSEAVEAALKTARLASGKPGILAFEGGYHGLTLGSLAVTERDHFRSGFAERLYDGVVFAPFPERAEEADSVLGGVEKILESGAPGGVEIGTLVVEPVQARGGARVPADGFMAALSDLAERHGALIVADEIMTGLGRCGSALASTRVGLRPDVVCVGKALGGGLPISACLASTEVMDSWPESGGEAIHTSTFLGHPLACRAASAVLGEIGDDLYARVDRVGSALLEGLRTRLGGHASVKDVRGLGLLLGVELDGDAPAVRLAERLLQMGVLVLPAGEQGTVLEMTPPVTLTDEQLDFAVAAIVEEVQSL